MGKNFGWWHWFRETRGSGVLVLGAEEREGGRVELSMHLSRV